MSAIPDRWKAYKACGNVIEGTRFICFKVPLRRNVQTGIRDIKEIWDIPAVLNKIPNLGAVVDLTNTSRYYNPAELQAAGVLHKKILIPGRIIPPENKVTEFTKVLDDLLGKDGDFVIGIHCTHGLNRTGYMVCRYLRDRLGIPAKDAIKRFEKARGYQIERQNYIADLLGKSPLPADVGSHTIVKPVSKNYSRSPLVEEDYVDEHQLRDRYNRFNKRQNRPYNNRYNGNRSTSNDNLNYNWRDRQPNQLNGINEGDGRNKESSDRHNATSESNRSPYYDFTSDY